MGTSKRKRLVKIFRKNRSNRVKNQKRCEENSTILNRIKSKIKEIL